MLTSTEAWIYVALRTGAALPLRVGQWRDQARVGALAASAVADLCAALFVLGYARPQLRLAVGGWWVALFLYSVAWTGWQIRSQLAEIKNPPIDTMGELSFEALGSVWGLPWFMLCVAPPLAAGFFLFFDVLAPNEWPPFLPPPPLRAAG